jgi:hypothetical protein
MNFYLDEDFKRAIQNAFNDGYMSAVSNAQDAEYITNEQADELLTELNEGN